MDRVLRAINDFLGRSETAPARPPTSSSLVREAFDQTAVGLTLVSLEGEFFLVNRAFCELSGLRARRSCPGPAAAWSPHAGGRRRPTAGVARRRLPAERRRPPVEKRLRRRDGSHGVGAAHAGLMRDAAGNPKFVIVRLRRTSPSSARATGRCSPPTGSCRRSSRPRPIAIYATDLDGTDHPLEPGRGAHLRLHARRRPSAVARRSCRRKGRMRRASLRERALSGEVLTEPGARAPPRRRLDRSSSTARPRRCATRRTASSACSSCAST